MSEESNKKNSKIKLGVLVIVTILLIIAVILVIMVMKKSEESPNIEFGQKNNTNIQNSNSVIKTMCI